MSKPSILVTYKLPAAAIDPLEAVGSVDVSCSCTARSYRRPRDGSPASGREGRYSAAILGGNNQYSRRPGHRVSVLRITRSGVGLRRNGTITLVTDRTWANEDAP